MKIHKLSKTIKSSNCNQINFFQKFTVHPRFQSLKDIFVKNPNKGLKEITRIKADTWGTCCKGSIPLREFERQFKNKKEYNNVIKKGISTNKDGFAFSFLKTKADNPISTSFVHDCSVMYLYNEQKNTHFLYHIFPKISNEELDYMIKNFMPEGFTQANIVPGGEKWVSEHQKYLPEVFKTIKENNPEAIVNVYHNSSFFPEIVGYKGEVFEIMNHNITEQILNKDSIQDKGQATFKISDIYSGNTLYKIHYANEEELKKYKKELKSKNYDNEINKVLLNIINKRLQEIEKIKSFNSKEDLFNYINSKFNHKELLKQEYHHDFYLNIIEEEIKKFN